MKFWAMMFWAVPIWAAVEVPIQPAFVPKRTPITHRVRSQSAQEVLAARNPEFARMLHDPEGYKREMLQKLSSMTNSFGKAGGRKGGDPMKALTDGRFEKAAAEKLKPDQVEEMKRGLRDAILLQQALQREIQRLQEEGKLK